MPYKNAASILPAQLIAEIQEYVQGQQIYIPRKSGQKLRWGSKNGTRAYMVQRNRDIRRRYALGEGVSQLAELFHLSEDAIRKIIYHRPTGDGQAGG